jgi:quinol monooxygenase YgiN
MVRLSVLLHAPNPRAMAIRQALLALMRATRVQPGCLGCHVWSNAEEEDGGDGGRTDVHYEERWASELAMETRVRSDAFTKVLEVLEAAAEVPQVEFDFVSRHQGLEYVEAVRREHQ